MSSPVSDHEKRLRIKYGERLRAARKAKGLSQGKLSDLTNIPQSYISAVEIGRLPIRPEQVEVFAKALGVPPESILFQRNHHEPASAPVAPATNGHKPAAPASEPATPPIQPPGVLVPASQVAPAVLPAAPTPKADTSPIRDAVLEVMRLVTSGRIAAPVAEKMVKAIL